jgi:uncharacterized RDD family membrane protein YckC
MNTNSNSPGYASFGRRFLAILVDGIFLNLITIPLLIALYGVESLTSTESSGGLGQFLITWLLPAAITIGFWLTLAATPGKLLTGIRVVHSETGERLTFAQGVIRYLGYLISFAPLLLGYFWMLWNPRKQTWHDLMAKSVVIRRDTPAS